MKESIVIKDKATVTLLEKEDGNTDVIAKVNSPLTLKEISMIRDTLTRYLRKRSKKVKVN